MLCDENDLATLAFVAGCLAVAFRAAAMRYSRWNHAEQCGSRSRVSALGCFTRLTLTGMSYRGQENGNKQTRPQASEC